MPDIDPLQVSRFETAKVSPQKIVTGVEADITLSGAAMVVPFVRKSVAANTEPIGQPDHSAKYLDMVRRMNW